MRSAFFEGDARTSDEITALKALCVVLYSIHGSSVLLSTSPCRATALSAARLRGTNDLEMELLVGQGILQHSREDFWTQSLADLPVDS
jgi:hypothetical protein